MPQLRCPCRQINSAPGQGRDRPTCKDWPHINLHFVDDRCVKGFTKQLAAALEQHAGDFFFAQIPKHSREGHSSIDERVLCPAIGKQTSLRWQFATPRDHNAPRLTRSRDTAHGQTRVVGSKRFRTDKDGIDLGAQSLRVAACYWISDPAGLARATAQSPIQTHAAFRDDKWLPRNDPFIKSLIQTCALLTQYADADLKPGFSQLRNSFPIVPGVSVECSDDNFLQTCLD